MLIKIPVGHAGLTTRCRCRCQPTPYEPPPPPPTTDRRDHVCFGLGSPAMRGFCPPCFKEMLIVPQWNEARDMHNAYVDEMTRIGGFRIINERSFEAAARPTLSLPAAPHAARCGSRPPSQEETY